jgi:hypothetical protein
MSSQQSSPAAQQCPPDAHVARAMQNGAFYCAPTHPGGAVGQILGHATVIPIAILLVLYVAASRPWNRLRRRKP